MNDIDQILRSGDTPDEKVRQLCYLLSDDGKRTVAVWAALLLVSEDPHEPESPATQPWVAQTRHKIEQILKILSE